ncbi:MAG TPA: plasma-membrane proton-efflux P-type ATPase [Verrucomicrobiae bacterium]|nr:plasma-membrane proton-efflux P-type ATPase [Verrucomicrobiae bacterium]
MPGIAPNESSDSAIPSPSAERQPGLTSAQALARLKEFGPNAVIEEKAHPLVNFVKRFWAPIPWLLEATIILQLFLGEHLEAAVIGGLLLLNATLSLVQESRAQKALALLRQQLRVLARVRRDGAWTNVAAEELVPGDLVHLRQGTIVPADVKLGDGSLLVDQSALTGESAAVTIAPGKVAHAGSMVRAGEATGEVTATGARTFFGKTAELVRTAGAANRQEHEIVAVVKNLFVLNAAMVVLVVGYAHYAGMSLGFILPLLLTILLASIPVALPATFTLAAALGSVELSKRGVLITRLSALHDIASMTVLCSDKTGTLTRNEARVNSLWTAAGFTETDLLEAAALASDPAGQDPVDGAIIQAATQRGWQDGHLERIEFKPFDPATKRAEAVYRDHNGPRRYVKGAPALVAQLGGAPEEVWQPQAALMVARGQRVLGVAEQVGQQLRLVGLLGLEDAVREDSKRVVAAIQEAGVRTVMVTGDNEIAARNVAEQVGIPPKVCPGESLHGDLTNGALDCSVFAGVFPEDKFRLVRGFQRRGDVVGMSGDGVNDAPALRQAEAGIAVANATDVAKAAAAMVLTTPGLGGVVPAIETSRLVFQRIITYTLNMLLKKIEIMALLVIGFFVTRHKPLTPMLMVLFLFLNDFLTMSLATDRMGFARRPNRWNTRGILVAATVLAALKLVFSLGVFLFGYYELRLDMPHLQTLTFVTVILGSQGAVYLLRERGHFWQSPPSFFLVASTVFGLGVAALLAGFGLLMPALNPVLLLALAGLTMAYFVCLDWPKTWLFEHLSLR